MARRKDAERGTAGAFKAIANHGAQVDAWWRREFERRRVAVGDWATMAGALRKTYGGDYEITGVAPGDHESFCNRTAAIHLPAWRTGFAKAKRSRELVAYIKAEIARGLGQRKALEVVAAATKTKPETLRSIWRRREQPTI